MSKTASDGNSDTRETARTNIEVDREVWRQVRAQAVVEGKNVSEKLEEILKQHFEAELEESDTHE